MCCKYFRIHFGCIIDAMFEPGVCDNNPGCVVCCCTHSKTGHSEFHKKTNILQSSSYTVVWADHCDIPLGSRS